ncbi:MAG: hypothetical protein CO093_07920 [Alphaproteobacteria bacterium CG_4_9_14_3_um_filter_47_13]|nr:MAG: hypothetical protein CO093_07920 [Alphaproteobacteria bacterium CG_4_9_14_3_um_filter_47_13]
MKKAALFLGLVTAFNLATAIPVYSHSTDAPATSDADIAIVRPPSPIRPPEPPKPGAGLPETNDDTPPAPLEKRDRITTTRAAPFINLPAAFEKSVRGCTTDGHVYRLSYNIAVNFDDIGATPSSEENASLFFKTTKIAPETRLGVTGTNDFMATLKTIRADIHTAMQDMAGKLIDNSPSETIATPVFNELMKATTDTVSHGIKEKHNVTIIIETGAPKDQNARCPAEIPAPLPKS